MSSSEYKLQAPISHLHFCSTLRFWAYGILSFFGIERSYKSGQTRLWLKLERKGCKQSWKTMVTTLYSSFNVNWNIILKISLEIERNNKDFTGVSVLVFLVISN